MPTRWGQFTTAAWAAVLVAALAAVALVARVTVFTGSATPKAAGEQTLRLDPGTTRARSHPARGGGETAALISGGDYATCAVVEGSRVDCWGDGAHGQLGDGTQLSALAPVHVSLGRTATFVSAGGSHACAVLADGTVRCWGSNAHGELGDGSTTDSAAPVPVAGLHDVATVAAGAAHTCALLHTGAVECWGANGNGQLGNDTTIDSTRPVRVQSLPQGVHSITAGLAHTCAAIVDGSVDCWGSNANGELGNGTLADSSLPFPVAGLTGKATEIDAGDAHTCALLTDGTVDCWGWNIEGQLGNGGGSDSPSPVEVSGLRAPATAVAAGGSHTCALLRTGGVVCWGANLYGQLGNGTTSDSATPTPVAGLGNGVAAIAAGLYHSCAILEGGSATCWGWNAQGELGDGTTTSASSPVGVAGLGLAPDGSGRFLVAPPAFRSGTRHATVSLTYIAAPGGIHDGAVAVTVPSGWSAPSTRGRAPGYSTATAGRVLTVGRTISVTHLTLGSGRVVTITYGSTARGGPGARIDAETGAAWPVREQSSSSGNLSLLTPSPVVHVLAPDGAGTLAATTGLVPNGARGRSVSFLFTAGRGGMARGTLSVSVPDGWSPPSTDPAQPGYVHASSGTVSVGTRSITVGGLTLHGGATLKLTYANGRAPQTNVGAQPWEARSQSSPGGELKPLAASPRVNVLSADGSGRVSGFQTVVSNGAHGVHLAFTYQADVGGVQGGALTLTVPRGWPAPSRSAKAPGYVTASVRRLRVAGRTVVVPLAQLGSGATVQVTYGAGAGADAPSSNVGPQQWTVRERSSAGARLRPLAGSPQVTVLSADGSGRLARASGAVAAGSSGNTVAFVYVAAPGGLQDGTVTLTVPDGWSAPSTNAHDPGYTIATAGSIAVAGRTITLTHVTLAGGGTLSVLYGSRSGGGPGAAAPHGPVGPALWPASEQSTPSGTLKPLRR